VQGTLSLLAEPQAVRPSFEALVERLFRNFTRVGFPKAERFGEAPRVQRPAPRYRCPGPVGVGKLLGTTTVG